MPHLWLERLEDPFETFPLQSVARSLAASTDEMAAERFADHGWYGVSSAYYTDKDLHDIEVVELMIGAGFVLGQAAITQAVSIVRKVHRIASEPNWIPTDRGKIMALESTVHAETGLPTIAVIDCVANYFKHRHEWSDNWDGPSTASRTINMVRKFGLRPKEYHNLENALGRLGTSVDKLNHLTLLVVEWRERLAKHLRNEATQHGF